MFVNMAIVLTLFALIVIFGTQIFLEINHTNIIKTNIVSTAEMAGSIYQNQEGEQKLKELAERTNTSIVINFTGGVIEVGAREGFETTITRGGFLERRGDCVIYEEYSVNSGGERVTDYLTAASDYGSFTVEVRQTMQGSRALISRTNLITRLLILIAFVLSLGWAALYSRIFTYPIREMNRVTKEMARLNFSQRIHIEKNDELGELAAGINDISNALSGSLSELRVKNELLTEELERFRGLEGMRKRFVSDVSHELKTPLSIIQSYAEALTLSANKIADKKLGEKTVKYSAAIIDEAQRMNKLVYDLLNLTNYQSGTYQLKLSAVMIDELLADVLEKVSRTKQAEGIEFTIDCTPYTIKADPARLEQVLNNLLSNAISHAESMDGGQKLIKLKGIVTKQGYNVSVFNTGEYIPADNLDKIWTAFFRGDSSRSREGGRHGIGLSIVKALLDLHGATYDVRNVEGGVEFFFELKHGIANAEQPSEESEEKSGGGESTESTATQSAEGESGENAESNESNE